MEKRLLFPVTLGKSSSSLALVWNEYNVDFFFCAVGFHTKICKQNHMYAKVIHSFDRNS